MGVVSLLSYKYDGYWLKFQDGQLLGKVNSISIEYYKAVIKFSSGFKLVTVYLFNGELLFFIYWSLVLICNSPCLYTFVDKFRA